MDDEIRQALDELRAELRDELRSSRTPTERSSAREHAREDLEDVLRREGYRLSRRQLDRMIEEDDERRFNARLDKALADRAAAEAEAEGDDEQEADGVDEEGKPKAKAKAKLRKVAGGKDEEDEGEWV